MVKTEGSSPKTGKKARMPALTTLIQHSTRSSSQCNKARKRNKMHTDQKEIKLPLLADYTVVQIGFPRNLKIFRIKFSKAAGYNINTQIQIEFLHIKYQPVKTEIKNTIPLTTAPM